MKKISEIVIHTIISYKIRDYDMKKPNCNCRRCIAMKMWRDPNHPNWSKMFWDSVQGYGKFERSPRWQDRKNELGDDITQFEMGMNNRMHKRKRSQIHTHT